MARNTKPIFSTSTTWSYTNATGGVKTGEAIEINDYPPTAQHIGSVIITATLASGTDSCTVSARLGYGFGSDRIWGKWQNLENVNGSTSFTLSTTENQFEANLYTQTWWTVADAIQVRIDAIGSGPNSYSGYAAIILV